MDFMIVQLLDVAVIAPVAEWVASVFNMLSGTGAPSVCNPQIQVCR